jgi:uncharacterized protein YggE
MRRPSTLTLTLGALLPTLLLAPSLLLAASDTVPLVTVGGSGTVQVAPDEAVVRLGIEAQAVVASEAQRAANGVAGAILTSLGSLGVPAEAVQTSSLQLYPVYESRQPTGVIEEPRITGYRATNTVAITLADLAKIGPVVDAAIAAGANRIESVDFRLRDDAEARRAALTAAVRDARDKAETIAAALGLPLGEVAEIVESGVSAPPIVYREAAMRMAADAGTPVATGSLSVEAAVTVRYRLGTGE